MSFKRRERQELVRRQNGISPITGSPLVGKRLETHHIEEVVNGGSNSINNKQAIPIAEHLGVHLQRAKDLSLSPDERLREMDTVMGRICELTELEKMELADVAKRLIGVRVRFF